MLSVTITIDDNKYLASFPNVGQKIQIEINKQRYSSGQYGSMLLTGTQDAVDALDLIDAISTFEVVCPDFIKDFKPGISFSSLPLNSGKQIVDQYTNIYRPFYKKIIDQLKESGNGSKNAD